MNTSLRDRTFLADVHRGCDRHNVKLNSLAELADEHGRLADETGVDMDWGEHLDYDALDTSEREVDRHRTHHLGEIATLKRFKQYLERQADVYGID